MNIYSIYPESIPSYALPYLINGDDSGLDNQDKLIIDGFMQYFYSKAQDVNGHVVIDLDDCESGSYFTWSPAFGLACDVYDCRILILVNQEVEEA